MTLRITIDIFSGRPNPVIELDGSEAREALSRLQPVRELEKGEPVLPAEPTLGYRGMILEQIGERSETLPEVFRLANGDLFGPGLAHKAQDENFEDFVYGSTGLITRLDPGQDLADLIRNEKDRFLEVRAKYTVRPGRWPKRQVCKCGPHYEPAWWNDAGLKQWNNNCYNYATNYRTDTFAQPGNAAGAIYTSLSCAAVTPAAVADDLIDAPGADNECPEEGHLVALVIWPGVDFHWYRKGRNGRWTHKPGSTPATNRDNSGALIPDPRTADRGAYTDFCTFMVVRQGHIKIS
jgi:hypothetical protein